jgi:transcriptional regulator with XRE-family HTH domain
VYRDFFDWKAMNDLVSPDAGWSYANMGWPEKIRRHREKARLSQGELAEMVGVRQSRISQWENGRGEPGPGELFRLSRALGVTLDYLADDSADEPPTPTPQLSPDDVVRLTLARRYPLPVLVELLAPIQPGYLEPRGE